MKHFLVWLSVFCAPLAPAGAADRSWPQKGDKVHIAARLEAFSTLVVMGPKMPDVPALEACTPTTLRSRSDKDDHFIVKDDKHHERKLVGHWLSMFYKTWEECEAQAESVAPPRVKATSGKYALGPEPVGG